MRINQTICQELIIWFDLFIKQVGSKNLRKSEGC